MAGDVNPSDFGRRHPDPGSNAERVAWMLEQAKNHPCVVCGDPDTARVALFTPEGDMARVLNEGQPPGYERIIVYAVCEAHDPESAILVGGKKARTEAIIEAIREGIGLRERQAKA